MLNSVKEIVNKRLSEKKTSLLVNVSYLFNYVINTNDRKTRCLFKKKTSDEFNKKKKYSVYSCKTKCLFSH